jgi:hypothetical protein
MTKNTLGGQRGTHYLVTRNTLWTIRRHARGWQQLTAIPLYLLLRILLGAGMLLLGLREKVRALLKRLKPTPSSVIS